MTEMCFYRDKVIVALTFVLLVSCSHVCAQSYKLSGSVEDAFSGQPLSNVSVYNSSTKVAVNTDNAGHFVLTVGKKISLTIQLVGYKKSIINFFASGDTSIVIQLNPKQNQLDSVVITSGSRQKYSNKNNPAVALIRQVIEHKPENRLDHFTTASYEKYAKLSMYIDRFPKWMAEKGLFKKYQFLLQTKDTTLVPGKGLMPVYIEESISQNYLRKNPAASNAIVKAEKKVDYGEFIDTRGLSLLFNRLFEDINIYDNNIVAFTKQFISPIADAGPVWYKYFIVDTISENGRKSILLSFMPRNKTDMLFTGTMNISMDGRYAVQKIEFHTNKNINLGVVRNFSVKQTFTLDTFGNYHLSFSDVLSDFGLYQKLTGIVGERTVSISNFRTDISITEDSLKFNDDPLIRKLQNERDDYWQNHRPSPLSTSESLTYNNVDSLHNMKSYRRITDWMNAASSGYKSFGKFQVGPLTSFLDYNPVEGVKPRIGGRTTSKFSDKYFLEAYAGYGFKDKEVKHFARLSYALHNKSVYGYPKEFISISSKYDTKIPGQADDAVNGNILFAVQSGNNNRYFYNRIYQMDYTRELDNHWSYGLSIKSKNQKPGGDLRFQKVTYDGGDSLQSSMQTTALLFWVRWAPHEQFYQNGGTNRIKIPNRFPVFTFTNETGVKGPLNGQYNYNLLQLSITKKFYMSVLGVSEAEFDAGYLMGQVPWPLLIIHAGNQGYGIQSGAFNMMNYMEFMSDHYVSLGVTHHFNGLFFNRIPLIKKLKWREIIGTKILFGGLRNENIPDKNESLFHFPYASDAQSYYLGAKPYIEVSAGVSNIFKVLRVDVIKRLTYLDHPDIQKWSVKASFNLEL
jgi:hypothetical protein